MRLDEAQKLAVYLVDMIGSVFIRQRSSDQYDVNFCLNSKEYTIKEFKHEKLFQKTTTQEIHQHVSQRAEMGISQLNDQRIDDQLVVRDDSSLDQQCESDQKIRETKKMAQILNSSNMTTTDKKKKLNDLLKNFDWHYLRTEDRRVRIYWSKIHVEIQDLKQQLGEDGEYLFTKYHRRAFPECY